MLQRSFRFHQRRQQLSTTLRRDESMSRPLHCRVRSTERLGSKSFSSFRIGRTGIFILLHVMIQCITFNKVTLLRLREFFISLLLESEHRQCAESDAGTSDVSDRSYLRLRFCLSLSDRLFEILSFNLKTRSRRLHLLDKHSSLLMCIS